MRFAIPAAAMLLLSGFTQAELEKAKSTTEFFKDAYWKCLATKFSERSQQICQHKNFLCSQKVPAQKNEVTFLIHFLTIL